jgi:hypothetical protein
MERALLMLAAVLPGAEPPGDFAAVRPLVQKYCLACHSTKTKKGDLDLERFATTDDIRKNVKPWQAVVEMLEAGEMPPKDKPQPSAEERKRIVAWTRGFLDAEAVARKGDPGRVPLRRLSHAEYDATVRDLTGVDLRPAREFPADGAGGEGFTNAAESLADISPALLDKYLAAAKEIAAHAVLLPDGFRFSSAKTRRDWTDECNARLRAFFAEFTPDGRLPLRPYLLESIRQREALLAGRTTPEAVAARAKLSPKYFGILWQALTDGTPSFPLDELRRPWRKATEKDVEGLVAEIAAWQTPLWRSVPIGSYRDHQTVRQLPNDPPVVPAQSLRFSAKPAPGQSEVVLHLSARELLGTSGRVVWQRPRFEAPGQSPLLLGDYPQFGPRFEVDFAAAFADTPKYLAAVIESAGVKRPAKDIAREHGLDAELLKRWVDLLAMTPNAEGPRREVAAVDLRPLGEKFTQNAAVSGWRRRGSDLPSLVANSSDKVENIPGRVPPHQVAVHPTPDRFVAVAWTSPIEGRIRVSASVTHAHPACGNGVAWFIEHRHEARAFELAQGALDLGKEARVLPRMLSVAKGDVVLLAVDARDANHVCDLTDIGFIVAEAEKPSRKWDLAADINGNATAGNPHGVWSFVEGPAKPAGYFTASGLAIPPDSLLARWRDAALDPKRRPEADTLAERLRSLLVGPRPAKEKTPDRLLYDGLVTLDGPLLAGLDLGRFRRAHAPGHYGLAKGQFEDADLHADTGKDIKVRLPAGLFRGREFVVDARLDSADADRAVQFRVTNAPPSVASWDGTGPVVASPAARDRLLKGFAEFRRLFPPNICFPQIIPTDEVVCLKLFHREDEPLTRLFLNDEQAKRLDRLWAEHRFVTQWPITEHKNLPLFIGFVTQDQPKELVVFYENMREPFRQRAEAFEHELEAAAPAQLAQLVDFASRAFRRPLRDGERAEFNKLYEALRKKGVSHDEAFRTVLARLLVSPSFLFHVEQVPPSKEPRTVSDWELASRLSYFLWSSVPDDELNRVATSGKLHEPAVLEQQTRRMLQDPRLRSLAIEFGTQMIHVRDFDQMKEKNEALFPTFNEELRKAIYEESILFFQDLFEHDRPVTRLIDADDTYLNETLARHYGIPGVAGPQWRRVEGVKKYGRGAVLGLASVQTKEAGASRTSPVLRGNWVVETLLGEKLPRPPANVPRLPEDERGNDGLTVRQLVAKHTSVPECAVCHVRIDPFGFALERYDAIGRWRDRDLGGLAIDTSVKLKDGTEFNGIEGLRHYLLTKKKDVVVRLFCRKLLGYALGRATTLSDQALIDEMVAELNKNDGRVTAAVLALIRSPQFRMIRGADAE